MSPALKRYRDAAIVVLLLAVPFFVLKANMKAPESQSAMDRTILRVSAPVEVAAATVARVARVRGVRLAGGLVIVMFGLVQLASTGRAWATPDARGAHVCCSHGH